MFIDLNQNKMKVFVFILTIISALIININAQTANAAKNNITTFLFFIFSEIVVY